MRHFGCLLAVLACTAPGPARGDPAGEVRCAEVAFSLAAERRDAEAFRDAVDPDARFVGREVSRGPEAVVAAWSPFFAENGPRIAWRPRIVEVLASGDYALSRGPFRLETRTDAGETVVRWGTFNSVWRRSADGRWRVVFDAGGAAVEDPPPDADALFADAGTDCPPAD